MPDDQRAYSEKEASEILQLAARLQEQQGEHAYTPGVSHDELVRIAKEAGIDPKFISQALSSAKTDSKPLHWGFAEEFDRVIEGEIDPDHFDLVHDAVGRQPNNAGLRQIGRSMKGQIYKGMATIQLDVTSRNGRTRLKAKSIPFVPYFATLHWMGILGVVLGGIAGENAGALTGVIVGSVMLGLGFLAFYLAAQASRRKALEVVNQIEEAIHEAIAESDRSTVPPAQSDTRTPLEERLQSLG